MAERFAIEARSLAAFRAGLGLLLGLEAASRLPYAASHYSDAGVLPRAVALPDFLPAWLGWAFPHFWSGSAAWAALAVLAACAAAAALAAGLRPRTAAALCLWLHGSLWLRDPLLTQASDRILLWLTVWACLLPLATRPGAPPVRSAAALGLLAQSAAVVLFSALHKLRDPAWVSGEALGLILSEGHRTRPAARLLAGLPSAPLTWAALAWESAAPWLLFSRSPRLRLAAAASFVLFAVAVGSTLDIGFFPVVIVLLAVPFLPGSFWDRLGWRPARAGAAPRESRGLRRAALALLALVLALAAAPPGTGGALGTAARLQGWDMFLRPESGSRTWRALAYTRDLARPLPLPGGLRWRLYREALGRERAWERAQPAYAAYLCRRPEAADYVEVRVERGRSSRVLAEGRCRPEVP